MRRIGRLADASAVPWANRRGTTRELLRQQTPDGRLILRLSVADVVEPGPFSALPGIDRVLVLLEGPGFTLSIDGSHRPVHPLQPVAFAGEAAVAVTAISAPSRDFNVMTGRGLARAAVAVRHGSFAAPAAGFVFIAAGAYRWGAATQALAGGDLIACDPSANERRVDGEGVAVLVALASP